MPRIKITSGDASAYAELNDTDTAKQVWDELPIESTAQTWGDEVYFSISLQAKLAEDAAAEQDVGSIAYWPPGNALCIFFGPTPMSSGDAPVAASPVNRIGEIDGDPTVFASVSSGDTIVVEAAQEQ